MSAEQPTKMWSGRFREPLDPTFEAWQRSVPFDYRLLPQEIAASKAHARAIAAAGILTEAELASMLSGLDQVLAQPPATASASSPCAIWTSPTPAPNSSPMQKQAC